MTTTPTFAPSMFSGGSQLPIEIRQRRAAAHAEPIANLKRRGTRWTPEDRAAIARVVAHLRAEQNAGRLPLDVAERLPA